MIKNYIPYLACLVIGFLLGWIIINSFNKEEVDPKIYEQEQEIQKLEYEKQIKQIEIEYLHRIHLVENADSTQLDSIWNVYGF